MVDNKKSMLIIDTPEACLNCDFCFEIDEGIDACCQLRRQLDDIDYYRMIDVDYCQDKPMWCPLCELPKKKKVEPESMNGVYGIDNARRSNFYRGWNTCIDMILIESYKKKIND